MKMGILLLTLQPKESVEFCLDNGFSAVEVSLENLVDKIDRDTLVKLSEECAHYGVYFSVHAPSSDLNIASFNDGIRQESFRQIKKSIELCSGIVRHITIHTNYYPNINKNGHLERVISGLTDFSYEAKRNNVILSIENVYERSTDQLLDYMLLVNNSTVKLTLDIGHLVAYGNVIPEYAIRVLSRYVNNIHLSDNDKLNDQHLPLGYGSIDIISVLRQLEKVDYRNALIVEAKNEQDAIISKKYLEENFFC